MVRCDEELVTVFFGLMEEDAIAEVGPAQLKGCVDRVLGEVLPEGNRSALIEQDLQERAGDSSELTSWARTASTFQPSTPGNH